MNTHIEQQDNLTQKGREMAFIHEVDGHNEPQLENRVDKPHRWETRQENMDDATFQNKTGCQQHKNKNLLGTLINNRH